ncbi:MAG TPA: tail fiber domain-containing protein [Candidatus Kapabacteria bacterium]|nr:tail fiber domain-containing protein [Candidatus Kapabacteria bacterium]
MTTFKNIWPALLTAALLAPVSVMAQGWQGGSPTTTDLVTTATTTNVGIGINAPAVKLHVNSAGASIRASSTTDANHSVQLQYNGVNSNRQWNIHQLSSTGFSGVNGHGFLIEHYNGSSFSQPFVLTESGHCGINIGTTVINNTLDVKGSAAFGSTYAGTAAPSNGMLIEGTLGIAATSGFGTHKLYVSGTAFATSWNTPSDIAWKENITPIDHALEKVLQLRGVLYDYRTAQYPEKGFPAGRQMGFIAQELEKVAPEVVTTNEDGHKAVAYSNLTALLASAVEQQQQTIVALKARIAKLKEQLHVAGASTAPGSEVKPLDLK